MTSAGRGEGKSTTVACLGAAFGVHPDRSVLAIDLDLREPTLHTHFEITPEVTLGSVLKGERKVEEAIVPTDTPTLHLLLPDPGGEDPGLLFRTPRISEVFEHARANYDLVLLDAPALVPVADTCLLYTSDAADEFR
ncbi:MAG: AAA family ATPase, partial [Candidatus Eisenbacteria bacterium]|nr:AAA family ATPase [Candidatus Eisenbacteria bacterium]